jgi:hypothetical protein
MSTSKKKQHKMKQVLNTAINRAMEIFHGHSYIYMEECNEHRIDDGNNNHPHHLIQSWSNYIFIYLKKTYEYLFIAPMAKLYLWGPSLGGWGFLGGQSLEEICAQNTHISSDFWNQHRSECVEMVSKNFYGLVVVCETLIYFITIFLIIRNLCKCINKCK